jgi:hypothetical protein
MKMASVFLRKNMIYLHAYSQTTQGAWIRWPPFFRIGWNDADINNKLNELLPKVFEGSQEGVPHPTDWEVSDNDGFYQIANVKTWRQFLFGDCKSIDIEVRDEGVYILPNEKRDQGKTSVYFVPCGDPIICNKLQKPDWHYLLTKAFERCK